MAFRNGTFAQRIGTMGDIAENQFEQWATRHGIAWVRYGLNRPPIHLAAVAPFIRYTPDYLGSGAAWEVQGIGADQTVKVKLEKLAALEAWSWHCDLAWFLWDSKHQNYTVLEHATLGEIAHYHGELRHFPEGKAYLAIDAGHFAWDLPDWDR